MRMPTGVCGLANGDPRAAGLSLSLLHTSPHSNRELGRGKLGIEDACKFLLNSVLFLLLLI